MKATKPVVAAVAALTMAASLAACGSSNKSSTSSAASTSASGGASTQASAGKGKKIAFLAAAKGNAYVDASVKAITADAAKDGVQLTVFDGQFNPQKQLSQCQDAITKKYDAIVALAAVGVAMIPCASQAQAANIPFVATNQPIGTSITTGEPTAKGVTSQVLTPLATVAKQDTDQVVKACGNTNPCNVVLLTAAKLIPVQAKAYETALAADSKAHPNIKVTSVDAGADRPGGLKAMQDTLQRISHPTVIASPNTQPMEGAAQALTEAGLKPGKDVKLVTNGGTSFQIPKIKSGQYYSTYVQMPGTEVELALQYAIQAANGQKPPTWTDPHKPKNVPYEITQANVNNLGGFTPEW
ncbi:MAG TPA: sugar ABC transporter substrate-binding protein [Thermoleophilaceae bacterium]|nr:sugar ABC transporter substrate-binding protein [Thermoleophilaceae bacterium]